MTTIQRLAVSKITRKHPLMIVCPLETPAFARTDLILADAIIALHRGYRHARFVYQELTSFSKEIPQTPGDLVSKSSWLGNPYGGVESRMFKECSGLFGVMPFYHSRIVHHKEDVPVTNHLFLRDAKFWPVFIIYLRRSDSDIEVNDIKPDYRMLLENISQYVGDMLMSVPFPQELFVSIAHAALGSSFCLSPIIVSLTELQ